MHRFRQALNDILTIGVDVLSIGSSNVLSAADASIRYGLLSGDALIVAVMRDHGLTLLASNDADFDRVDGLTRYSPLG